MSDKASSHVKPVPGTTVKTKVLAVETGLEGDDGYELYRLAVARERFRYPVVKVEVRVGVAGPLSWEEPSEEAKEEAAKLLLGLKKVPWWKRWWDAEAEKRKGMRWRVRG